MRNSILIMTMIALPLLAVSTYAGENLSFALAGDSYGFSSEDWCGGSYL